MRRLRALAEATLQTPSNGGWRERPGCCLMAPMPKSKPARCEDCYFQQNMLCALNLGKPCTTFRPAERGLAPERQLAFVFRAQRTTAAYAFPQPNA
ncbi:MAG: hypothetical protein QOE69_1594 [Thermoleophilaceae bacterium]|nr:hypothetical protein [Thermoleophilaceae bacterium]MEA2407475.1 hypothetical protein [Thermoleophilaceae bacterium]